MKMTLSFLLLLCLSWQLTQAQNTTNTGFLRITGGAGLEGRGGGGNGLQFYGGYASPDNGRLIIGDNTGWKFHLSTKDAAGTLTDIVTFLDNGNVGIGTTSPKTPLDIGQLRFGKISSFPAEGTISETIWGNYIIGDVTTAQQLKLGVSNDGSTRAEIFIDNSNRPDGTITFKTGNGGASQARMFIDGNGSVGIGTTSINNAYKLFVETGIRTRKVVVDQAVWPDYVFQEGYPLASLDSVGKYIKMNHHLPEIVTADSVEKNGVDLGNNQAALLKKIEELTLYIIQQKDQLEKQQALIDKILDKLKDKQLN